MLLLNCKGGGKWVLKPIGPRTTSLRNECPLGTEQQQQQYQFYFLFQKWWKNAAVWIVVSKLEIKIQKMIWLFILEGQNIERRHSSIKDSWTANIISLMRAEDSRLFIRDTYFLDFHIDRIAMSTGYERRPSDSNCSTLC